MSPATYSMNLLRTYLPPAGRTILKLERGGHGFEPKSGLENRPFTKSLAKLATN